MWLAHHGIKGQSWGVRNGPPYPLEQGNGKGGTYRKYKRRPSHAKEQNYQNRRNDQTLSKGTVLSTYSFDKNRTKDADMFYAVHNKLDKYQYDLIFNTPVAKYNYTKNGKRIWSGFALQYKIDNTLNKDLKVASEDSGSQTFKELYTKDKDFFNYVTDSSRMLKNMPKEQFRYTTYDDARRIINRLSKDKTYIPSEKEMNTMYSVFNYTLPYDGRKDNNLKGAEDGNKQRTKFFAALKDKGYGAVLDTNDAAYNAMHARSPVIVFDMENVVPKKVRHTYFNEKRISGLVYTASKLLNK